MTLWVRPRPEPWEVGDIVVHKRHGERVLVTVVWAKPRWPYFQASGVRLDGTLKGVGIPLYLYTEWRKELPNES